ncbi:hypothetical protein [Actinoallomurus sp. NPDC052274]|uniref:hypothetical protein n=1 Tax=Actinoallomurus sp. NPDC052274 TaxID=3155420 RepID=UPI003425FD0D
MRFALNLAIRWTPEEAKRLAVIGSRTAVATLLCVAVLSGAAAFAVPSWWLGLLFGMVAVVNLAQAVAVACTARAFERTVRAAQEGGRTS